MYNFHIASGAPSAIPADAAIALGNFDGVHLGHRRLFDALPADRPHAVFTFADLHRDGDLLCPLDERLKLIGESGIGYAIVADFDEMRDLTPAAFADFLTDGIGISCAVCGFNFTFGRGASGNADDLRSLLGARGVSVTVVDKVTVGEKTVSATAIRHALAIGDTDLARAMLGRPYSLTLPVVHGNGLGRKLGIPTLNQEIPADRAVPRYGVYAAAVTVNGKTESGICNIGLRPTVDGRTLCAETHIFGFDGDIYGESVKVELLRFIRDERKFPSVDALTGQIGEDIAAAKAYFDGVCR